MDSVGTLDSEVWVPFVRTNDLTYSVGEKAVVLRVCNSAWRRRLDAKDKSKLTPAFSASRINPSRAIWYADMG